MLRRRIANILRRFAEFVDPPRTLATPPGPAELKALTDHISYEVAAMEASAESYARNCSWLALDGFLLHARQLREFLWGRWNPRSPVAHSSVFAENYSMAWRGVRGGVPPTVERTKDAIDKQLAHIARERTDSSFTEDLGLAVAPLRQELLAAWKSFLTHLGSQPSAAHFQASIKKKCGELGVPVP